jgi:hypothetical protein
MDTQTARMLQMAKARAQLQQAQQTMQEQQEQLDALQRRTTIVGAKSRLRSAVFLGLTAPGTGMAADTQARAGFQAGPKQTTTAEHELSGRAAFDTETESEEEQHAPHRELQPALGTEVVPEDPHVPEHKAGTSPDAETESEEEHAPHRAPNDEPQLTNALPLPFLEPEPEPEVPLEHSSSPSHTHPQKHPRPVIDQIDEGESTAIARAL